MRSSSYLTASVVAGFGSGVREETAGASLDAGGSEVASELWTERVFCAGVSRCDQRPQ